MKPINFLSANKVLTGHNDNIDSLPVYHGEGMYISRWKCESLLERLSILWHGMIWVCVASDMHPPISITGHQAAQFTHPDAEATDEA